MCVKTNRNIDSKDISVKIAANPHPRGTVHNLPADCLWNWSLNYKGAHSTGLGNCTSYEIAADEASKAIAAARKLEIDERRRLQAAL